MIPQRHLDRLRSVALATLLAVTAGAGAAETPVEQLQDHDPDFVVNAGLNDAWYNQLTVGQGFFFNVFPELGLFFLAWFTYDTERPDETVEAILGEPGHRWVTATGTWEGDTVTLTGELTSGGIFDSEEPAVDQAPNYGTITIVFHDCNNATLTYNFPSLGLSGVIELTRVTNDNVELCETLAAG